MQLKNYFESHRAVTPNIQILEDYRYIINVSRVIVLSE